MRKNIAAKAETDLVAVPTMDAATNNIPTSREGYVPGVENQRLQGAEDALGFLSKLAVGDPVEDAIRSKETGSVWRLVRIRLFHP